MEAIPTSTTTPKSSIDAGAAAASDGRQATPPINPGQPYTATSSTQPPAESPTSYTGPKRSEAEGQSPKMSHGVFGGSTAGGAGAGGKEKEQRLIVVSNRLPVTISKDDKGEYHFKVSLKLTQK